MAPSLVKKWERARQVDDARYRLRAREVMALIMCFLAPAAATFALHLIRGYLTWHSEGLFSNFNLGIVFLATEIGPLLHSTKLLLSQTLHLQRIVHTNPYRVAHVTPSELRELLRRVGDLEARVLAKPGQQGYAGCECNDPQQQQSKLRQLREDVTREVRTAVDPDIESVVRAVRRYERKTSTLTHETEQQMLDLRRRLDDAIALSAVVARNSAQRGWAGWAADGSLYVARLPVLVVAWMASLFLSPFAKPLDWVIQRARLLVDEGDGAAHGGARLQVQMQGRPAKQGRPSKQGQISPSAKLTSRAS